MRPEQRQRLAVLVDTAIVKVGLTSDFICHKAQHSSVAALCCRPSLSPGMAPCPVSHVTLQTEASSGRALLGTGASPAPACQELWAQPLSSWAGPCACQAEWSGDVLLTSGREELDETQNC